MPETIDVTCQHCGRSGASDLHLNSPSTLPPVHCPLLIQLEDGRLIKAIRTSFVRNKGDELVYQEVVEEPFCEVRDADTGCQVHTTAREPRMIYGRFPWTYP